MDLIAETFADELPPAWSTRAIRDRVAHAEYESASDPAKLIPEQRVADARNRYVERIGAPQEALVNVAEIHNLRDGSYSMARFMWSRGSRTIWTMPNIYAVGRNEKVADGCTALEVLRVVWDLSNQFENLRGARERVKHGVVVSDTLKPLPEGTVPPMSGWSEIRMVERDNPVEDAEIRYVREHGGRGLNNAIEALLYDLFPSQT